MKTSNIKPQLSAEQVRSLPMIADDFIDDSFKRLTEGHFSQAFSFESRSGKKRVLRLSRQIESFYADQYAHQHFDKKYLPVPKVLEIGNVEDNLFYCISELAPGVPSDQLNETEFNDVRDVIEETFAQIFTTNMSSSNGFGGINLATGNGKHHTYQPEPCMEESNLENLRKKCAQQGIDPHLVDSFAQNYASNSQYVHFERRLTHGDLGFDNVLIDDGRVTAIIDWSSMGYGDWLHDYSRLEFWYPGKHTPAMEFAHKYNLDTQNFQERWLTHTADHALSTLGYVFEYEDSGVAQWIRDNLASKLDPTGVK